MTISATTTGALTIADFLDQLAAKQSTPGGGGAAAVTGGQAAALLSMVINFTLGSKKYAAVEVAMQGYLQQSESLRHTLLALADQDVAAFNAVAACYAMPKTTDEEKAARTTALQTALKGAAQTPLTTAERCLDIMHLVEPVGRQGNTNVVSDAATALYLAQAALQSALVNVNINLKFIKDEAFVADYAARCNALLAAAATAYTAGKTACEAVLEIAL